MKALAAKSKDNTKFEPLTSNQLLSEAELNLAHVQAAVARIDLVVRAAVLRWQHAGRDPNDAFRGLVVSDEDAVALAGLAVGTGWGDVKRDGDEPTWQLTEAQAKAAQAELALLQQAHQRGVTLRLPHLIDTFGLDKFAVDAFLLCLAPAVDLRYEQLYSYLQNDINRKRPTVDLLLQLLAAPGAARLMQRHAFAPDAPLMRHRLLRIGEGPQDAHPALLGQVVTVDRAVVAWLLGHYHPPVELSDYADLMPPTRPSDPALLSEPVRAALNQAAEMDHALLIFRGADQAAQEFAARRLAAMRRQPLLHVDMAQLIAAQRPLHSSLMLALRDARLNRAVTFLTGWDACLQDQEVPPGLLEVLLAHLQFIVVAGRSGWQPNGLTREQPVLSLVFDSPDFAQRRQIWRHYLAESGEDTPDAHPTGASLSARNGAALDISGLDIFEVAARFALTTGQIRDALSTARDQARLRGDRLQQTDLYAGARIHSGARLGDMARKITPRYDWDDIILPDDQIEILRELVATVRARSLVLEEWGLGRKLASSAAVTVLFAGPPGTGKTMAAEVIAKDLALDLYKIDLSSLVSKYIGETEKNLERVFTEAQSSNAILFFDEADAIFGKRSGVKDAHDRYANLEISYLLQRMEIYDGVTILATNLRSNLDDAFIRRLQFAVDVPFPDEKHRLRIWETLFPASVPRAGDVDLEDLAKRYRLAGGNIRNVLLGAAYLAAAGGGEITMRHLLHSTRREFQKMGRLVLE